MHRIWDVMIYQGLDPDHHSRPKLGTTIWSAGRKPPGICGPLVFDTPKTITP